jgi:bidirectional [NiFe] hydrogenase diaphorase subunit
MKILIDGRECEANHGDFILDIARKNNIYIPTLCHSDALPGLGSCRLCIVEAVENNKSRVVTSCLYPITREIEVRTNSDKIRSIRKTIIMLLSARCPDNELIKKLKDEYGVTDTERFAMDKNEECILCGLCVKACDEIGSSAIQAVNRGVTKKISTPYDEPSTACIGCGACAQVCPTGAIKMTESQSKRVIWNKEFEMLPCSKCGCYYTTMEQEEFIKNRLCGSIEEILCPDCRKKNIAEKFALLYGRQL